jgi:hypothetical protein
MLAAGPSLADYLPDGTPVAAPAPIPEGSSRLAPEHLQARPSAQSAPSAPLGPVPVTAPSAPAARRSAGLTLLGAAVATAAGAWLGGGWGAGAGLLLFGGTRNALRARSAWVAAPPDPTVATRSATLALVGLVAGGYLGYRAYARNTDG